MENLQTKKTRKETIYWNELRKGYNNEFNTTYNTVRNFVFFAYARHKTIKKTSKILGVSRYTFWKKLQALNISRFQKGHRGTCKCLRALWSLNNISELSSTEIAKQINFTRSYVLVVMKRNNIVWNKGKRINSGIHGRIKPQTPKNKPRPFIFGRANLRPSRANKPTS